MDIFLIVLGALLCVLAIIGSLLPVLPGPLLGYGAFVVLQLTGNHPFGRTFFVVRALIIVALTVLDYVAPAWGTKKFGGTKRGVRGSNIGLIVAVIILPICGIVIGPFGLLGLIGGPFVGAYLGEKYAGKQHQQALKAARGSFIGFITGSFLKVIVTIVMGIYFVFAAYHILGR